MLFTLGGLALLGKAPRKENVENMGREFTASRRRAVNENQTLH